MQVKVLNRQRKFQLSADGILTFAERLAPLLSNIARNEMPEEILVVLVSDRKISSLHQQFMGIAGASRSAKVRIPSADNWNVLWRFRTLTCICL
jgi:ssRNA-specific RNase YbeY (16S rRNA maturation enzyme)